MITSYNDSHGRKIEFTPLIAGMDETPADTGSEANFSNRTSNAKEELYTKKLRALILVGTLAITPLIYKLTHNDHANNRLAEIEECVEAEVGYDVSLTTHPEHGSIIKPAPLVDEINACEF